MKNLFISLFLLTIAQSLVAQSMHFGIKGGFNEAFIDGGPLPTGTVGKFLQGFHVGVFEDHLLGKNWSIQPALYYTIKGYKVTTDTQIPGPPPSGTQPLHQDGKQTYQYLELPINMLYNIKIKSSKIFIGGGPYMGYLLRVIGQKTTTVNNGTPVFEEIKRDVSGSNTTSGSFKPIDLGLNGLLGFGLKNGFLFSYSISYGFTNIIANQGNDPATMNPTNMTKNRVMNFSIGYCF